MKQTEIAFQTKRWQLYQTLELHMISAIGFFFMCNAILLDDSLRLWDQGVYNCIHMTTLLFMLALLMRAQFNQLMHFGKSSEFKYLYDILDLQGYK